MATSIFHRASGVALYIGAILITAWLVALASGPEVYAQFEVLFTSIPAKIVLFGFTAAIMFHIANGLRYLFWDMGHGYQISTANVTGWLTVLFGFFGAVAVWLIAGLV